MLQTLYSYGLQKKLCSNFQAIGLRCSTHYLRLPCLPRGKRREVVGAAGDVLLNGALEPKFEGVCEENELNPNEGLPNDEVVEANAPKPDLAGKGGRLRGCNTWLTEGRGTERRCCKLAEAPTLVCSCTELPTAPTPSESIATSSTDAEGATYLRWHCCGLLGRSLSSKPVSSLGMLPFD